VLKMLYPSFPDLAKVRNSLLASENIERFRATIAQNSNGKRFIVSLSCDSGYLSEVKLVEEVLNFVFHSDAFRCYLKGKPVLGDKAYDSERFIRKLLFLGLKPYIKVRESFRRKVVSSVRRLCKGLVEVDSLYRKRGMVEGIFGEVKQALGCYERTKDFQIAQLFVIAKFCVFNLWILALVIRIFQTVSGRISQPEGKELYL